MDTNPNLYTPKVDNLLKLKAFDPLKRLRTDPVVLDRQRQELIEIIDDATNELAALNRVAEISTQSFEIERKDYQRHLELAQSLLAPVRKLPVDMLLEIFRHHSQSVNDSHPSFHRLKPDPTGNSIAAKTRGYYGYTSRAEHTVPALTFTSVCHFWRQTALETPTLWNNINITTGDTIPQNTVRLVELLLHNSGEAVLDIRVDLLWQASGENVNSLFALLCANSSRWRSFVGYMDTSNQYQVASLSSTRGSLGRLESLSLFCDHRRFIGDIARNPRIPPEWREVFKTCPQLRNIGAVLPPSIELPYQQITHTPIRLSSSTWRGQLTRFSNLESGVLTISEKLDAHPASFTSLVQKLDIQTSTDCDMGTYHALIQRAVLPDLETLVFRGSSQNTFGGLPYGMHDFQILLKRSFCTITTLHITETIVCSALVRLLSILPTVTDFSLHAVALYGNKLDDRRRTPDVIEREEDARLAQIIVDMTVQSPTNSVLLPRLQSLEIQCPADRIEDLDGQLILDMVQSRLKSSRPDIAILRSIGISRRDRYYEKEFVRAMVSLKKQSGLVMSIIDCRGDIELRKGRMWF